MITPDVLLIGLSVVGFASHAFPKRGFAAIATMLCLCFFFWQAIVAAAALLSQLPGNPHSWMNSVIILFWGLVPLIACGGGVGVSFLVFTRELEHDV